jgi:hypothetical protein
MKKAINTMDVQKELEKLKQKLGLSDKLKI